MTKLTFAVAILALLSAALSIAGLLPLLVTQSLAALTLCVALFSVIAQSERQLL